MPSHPTTAESPDQPSTDLRRPPAAAPDRDAAQFFAEAVASVRYEQLAADVVETTRRSILDTLGVTVAASGVESRGPDAIRELATEWGGAPESTVIAYGGRLPAYLSAFVFGALAHSLDYDDFAQAAVAHPSAPTLAAAFPIAERVGQVDGRTFIAAVAAGVDVVVRLGNALHRSPVTSGWLPATVGVFGATAAAARLLALSPQQTADAFGLALHQASGTAQCAFGVGSSFRALRDGFNAKSAVLTALLAQKGVSGDRDAFEGEAGLFHQFFGGAYDRDVLLDGLGRTLTGAQVGYKPWPSCGYSHLFLTALEELIGAHNLRPDQVTRIVAVGGDDPEFHAQLEPFEDRVRPRSPIDAKFSLPFQLGKMLTRRRLELRDFTTEGLNDTESEKSARKVTWRSDEALIGAAKFGPAIVEVETTDDRVLRARCDHALGHPDNPLSWERLTAKFRDAVDHAAAGIPDGAADRVVRHVEGLEDLEDVSVLVRALSTASGGRS